MKADEATTSEIREKRSGFDRRDRTLRGTAMGTYQAGEYVAVAIGDRAAYTSMMAGETLHSGELIEVENGLWWRVFA